jgi:hypothetical protein
MSFMDAEPAIAAGIMNGGGMSHTYVANEVSRTDLERISRQSAAITGNGVTIHNHAKEGQMGEGVDEVCNDGCYVYQPATLGLRQDVRE